MQADESEFVLDPRLAGDCYRLGELGSQLVLLMNNALLPWFILVPKTRMTELCDLPEDLQQSLNTAVRQISVHLRQQWPVDKLNVAAIGNVVKQLHVHIVGRRQDDFCWPGVVWGRPEKTPYRPEQVEEIQNDLQESLGSSFICHPLYQEAHR